MTVTRALLIVSAGFMAVWLLTTFADPSSAVGAAGRVARSLAIGSVLGAALRVWWESRDD